MVAEPPHPRPLSPKGARGELIRTHSCLPQEDEGRGRRAYPLSPLGERVPRPGVFISRGGTGEGVALEQVEGETSLTNLRDTTLAEPATRRHA